MSSIPNPASAWPPPDTPEVRETLARETERRAENAPTLIARQLLLARARMLREGVPFESDEQVLADLDGRRGRG